MSEQLIQQLRGEIEGLHEKVEHLEIEIAKLKTEKEGSPEEIERLKTTIEGLHEEIERLKTENENFETLLEASTMAEQNSESPNDIVQIKRSYYDRLILWARKGLSGAQTLYAITVARSELVYVLGDIVGAVRCALRFKNRVQLDVLTFPLQTWNEALLDKWARYQDSFKNAPLLEALIPGSISYEGFQKTGSTVSEFSGALSALFPSPGMPSDGGKLLIEVVGKYDAEEMQRLRENPITLPGRKSGMGDVQKTIGQRAHELTSVHGRRWNKIVDALRLEWAKSADPIIQEAFREITMLHPDMPSAADYVRGICETYEEKNSGENHSRRI